MRIGALFTGGKDSTYSAFLASKDSQLVCLMNAESRNPDSYMFHTVGAVLLGKQAEAMGLPLERFFTEGEKEEELNDLRKFLSEMKEKYDLEGVVSGALASEYQFNRIGSILDELGMKSITPLWKTDVEKYLRDLVSDGFKAVIISVSAEGLGEEWLGREINEENLPKLAELSRKYRFHLGFEGGEGETTVLDGPNFRKRAVIDEYSTIHEGNKHYLDIKSAHLEEKPVR